MGEVDESVVANDNGQSINKGKGKVDVGLSCTDGNKFSGNVEVKKNV